MGCKTASSEPRPKPLTEELMANNPMADNAGLETAGIGVAADVVESTVETEVSPDVTQAVATTAKPLAPFDTTKAFSERLRSSVSKELDKEIFEMGLRNPVTGQPIRTKKELDAYKEQEKTTNEAHAKGIDSAVYMEMSELSKRVAKSEEESATLKRQIEFAKHDESLLKDPEYGSMYKANREAIQELAQNQDLNLEAAAMLFSRHNLSKIIEQAKQQASNSTLAKTKAASAASPGSLSGGGEVPTNDINCMSASEFESMIKKAERGELRKS